MSRVGHGLASYSGSQRLNPVGYSHISGSSAGMQPVNWLNLRKNVPSMVSFPSSGDNSPLSRFPFNPIVRRLVRLPSSGGISPVSLFH